MITWVFDLLFHRHSWLTVERRELLEAETNNKVGVIFIQRCETCGKMRDQQFRVKDY